jgi:hypothetical protein
MIYDDDEQAGVTIIIYQLFVIGTVEEIFLSPL